MATLRSGPEEIRYHLYTDEALSGTADNSKAFIRQMLALRKFFEWMTFIVGALVASEYVYNNSSAWEMFSIAFGAGQEISDWSIDFLVTLFEYTATNFIACFHILSPDISTI